MKKFAILAVIAVAATLSSCFNKAPKADLKEELDTLSYAAGLAQTQGLKRYLVEQVGMDTTYIDEFIKGLLEGAQADDSPKTKAYYAGVQIGQQISGQIIKNLNYQLFGEDSVSTVSLDNFMAGFIAGTTEKGALMTVEEADSTFMTKLQSFRARQIEKEYAEWKQQNIDFMAATAKKDGILSLGDGIFYTVETEGKGAVPADSNLVALRGQAHRRHCLRQQLQAQRAPHHPSHSGDSRLGQGPHLYARGQQVDGVYPPGAGLRLSRHGHHQAFLCPRLYHRTPEH